MDNPEKAYVNSSMALIVKDKDTRTALHVLIRLPPSTILYLIWNYTGYQYRTDDEFRNQALTSLDYSGIYMNVLAGDKDGLFLTVTQTTELVDVFNSYIECEDDNITAEIDKAYG